MRDINKKFPNGWETWFETHFEVVSFINTQVNIADGRDTEINRELARAGQGALYELAERWTDEWENMHIGREWDGEFFEEIYKWLEGKNLSPDDIKWNAMEAAMVAFYNAAVELKSRWTDLDQDTSLTLAENYQKYPLPYDFGDWVVMVKDWVTHHGIKL